MNRRKFLSSSAAALSGATLFSCRASANDQNANRGNGHLNSLVTTPPVLIAPHSSGCHIVWEVSRLARGWVDVEIQGSETSRFATDGNGFVPQHEKLITVRLDGLPAGSTGRYRTITEAMEGDPGQVISEWRSLKTINPGAEMTRFAVWNDTHKRENTIRRLDESTPRDIDFMVWNGDVSNDWHEENLIVPTLIYPEGHDINEGRPLCFIPGNHDVRGKWAFRLPEYVPAAEAKPYFALRSGPVACLFLNTGEDKADDHPSFRGRVAFDELRREQADWIKRVVVQPEFREAPFRVVFCHIPMRWIDERRDRDYDRFSWRSREYWHDSLVQWGAQVVISGHTHQHAWLPPTDEFPYAQLIGGGPQEERATLIQGAANQSELILTAKDLNGEILIEEHFQPIGS